MSLSASCDCDVGLCEGLLLGFGEGGVDPRLVAVIGVRFLWHSGRVAVVCICCVCGCDFAIGSGVQCVVWERGSTMFVEMSVRLWL